ncbi:hypothetical protein EXU30_17370 [Shewanella maritima]|uniref:Uncharacterized protein n=1 Tax=Shewanella maritima TaxID=2520507 RepID=A0A411PL36_9GAMM|nr:hypothetical protein [Shewanella maritima]QBF84243.1 hypothetical protein EXU30_17370 [Shewanella maritima]
MSIVSIKSRSKIDQATFSFGSVEANTDTINGYSLYCAGSQSHYIDRFMPIKGDKLQRVIGNLETLEDTNFVGKVKFKCGFANVNFKFSGHFPEKGVQVKTYITGLLFYSSAVGHSYISKEQLEVLIAHLKDCV